MRMHVFFAKKYPQDVQNKILYHATLGNSKYQLFLQKMVEFPIFAPRQ